ncbi:sigma-70 family RNA polymerase sigma factor [Leptolyngbya sp. FACHB-17]|uniref:sigma-70 family RNA polymerase sigma factor n=1 Tax=unclassified Leptolyngbya TaxID=2650499 RepID=UPI001680518F|nr:sigma-70 family RNA polymerase sigma factor [Leptolyngbya sp. FACHB-17]MBD2080766.1 sigma-70 family RNA polymerase sigma factor [Leptolyngbya sp. FACHB-17]
MQPRQSIIDLFSTFVQFKADSFGGWATDARLRRSIQTHLSERSEPHADTFWVVYWQKVWQQHPDKKTALGHLSAYLQEACYWSAYKTMPYLSQSRYRLSDCFQVAIAEVPRILKARDPDYPGSLKTYASQAFSNSIRDFLRQSREIDLCSDWGLLLKVSRKRLVESLQNAGLNTDDIDRWILAWSCFESVYLPTKSPKLRQLPAPNRETWDAIASCYNQQRHQLRSPGDEASADVIQKWLTACVNRVRSYLYPAVSSLNAPKLGEDTKEFQDDIVDPDQESLLTDLISQEDLEERQAQRSQLNQVLEAAIAKLDPASQELLQLYYQQNLTQQEIAKQLGIQQYAVSRKLSKAREALLSALLRWSQDTLHIAPTSDVGKQISAVLEEWLMEKRG